MRTTLLFALFLIFGCNAQKTADALDENCIDKTKALFPGNSAPAPEKDPIYTPGVPGHISLTPGSAGVCLRNTEFNIGGITYISRKEDVLALKGAPKNIIKDEYEPREEFEYDDMEILLFNDYVQYLTTFSPENKTPSGLHVGMSQNDAMKIIGYEHYDGKISSVGVLNCETDIFLEIYFDDNNIIKSIGFGRDIP
jgi:hypothetical protein